MTTCIFCGSEDVEYLGVQDGSGDFGSATCDLYHCNECGADVEKDCIEYGEDENEEENA